MGKGDADFDDGGASAETGEGIGVLGVRDHALDISDRVRARGVALLHDWRRFVARRRSPWRVPTPAEARRRSLSAPPTLSIDRPPRVSIVIPVFGKVEYTWACLESLARAPQRTPFEVIVVDDGSPDDTAQVVSRVAGVTLVRNETNLGFIGASNAGAARARGEYVCFLNNDTQTLGPWLDELVDTFEREPDAGLVGARLLYPDGRLQESGGLVFDDGSAANYGRLDDPDRPRYSYLREVDYCSGACILLPTSLFASLDGFDSYYAPAYYEDTDLAFRVRAAGKRCFVQPASRVVHFEGVTSGTDLRRGIKRHQTINQKKFSERWADELRRTQCPPTTRHSMAKDRGATARVLFVDSYVPRPDHDSGSLRMYNVLRLARRAGMKVSFVAREDVDPSFDPYVADLERIGIEVLRPPHFVSPLHALREMGADLDLVVLCRADNVRYLRAARRHAPRARVVFDTVDLHYLREEREARLRGRPTQHAARRKEQELGAVRSCDATLVVSDVERTLLQKECPNARVLVVSNIHEEHPSKATFGERRDFMFIGDFGHPPNVDAATWFVKEVLPEARPRLPRDAVFHVVGASPPPELRALASEGVIVRGQVDDLAPWFERPRLSVAPLRYGAGVKGKVNMSMAHGVPVVATSLAVEGMHLRAGEDALVADDAKGFADAMIRLWNDEELWSRLSENGRRSIRENFSFEVALRSIRELQEMIRARP